MNAIQVNSTHWKNAVVLFDNDDFSVIKGVFLDGKNTEKLGIRWNQIGSSDSGFPVDKFGNPEWFVLPPELDSAVLLGLAKTVLQNTKQIDAATQKELNATIKSRNL
ncbi:MAG: hypothetical protein IKO39_08295 [Treponema sp.]|nr:hypothetical protein [Treponema sp.]